jgi:hypothetical protein
VRWSQRGRIVISRCQCTEYAQKDGQRGKP